LLLPFFLNPKIKINDTIKKLKLLKILENKIVNSNISLWKSFFVKTYFWNWKWAQFK